MPALSTRLPAAARKASVPPRQNPRAPTVPVHSGSDSRWACVAETSSGTVCQSSCPTIAMHSCRADSSLRSKPGSIRQNTSGTSTT
jgi:hypothetical protein